MFCPLDSSDLLTMVNQQEGEVRCALFTDVDDTLIDRACRADPIAAAWELREWADTYHYPIILVSGADFAGVLTRLHLGEIPPAEAIVGGVGTELWLRQSDGGWLRDKRYDRLVRASGYRRQAVTEAAASLVKALNTRYPELHLTFQQLAHQPQKVSLHFFAEDSEVALVAKKFRREFPQFYVITCKEIHYNAILPTGSIIQKYCLDIVPATKQTAVTYLIDRLGLTCGYKAGDSGNDVDMLLNPDPLLPILVGGHKPEASQAVMKELALSRPGLIQYLKNGRPIYIESGNRVGAQSILHATRIIKMADRRVARRSLPPVADRPIVGR